MTNETTAERRLRLLVERDYSIDNGDRDACDIGREALALLGELARAHAAELSGGWLTDVRALLSRAGQAQEER